MSKKVFILIFILFIGSSSVALAETYGESTTTTAEVNSGKTMPQRTMMAKPPIEARTGTKAADLMQSKMQMFKEKIQGIQDEKKKLIVERISTNVTSKNTALTTKMTSALTRMSAILTNLSAKAASLKAAGNDTTALDSAITSAQTAITSAQTAVTTQSQKEYTATITTDTNLKSPMGQMISQFRQDVMNTHKSVTAAKQALMKVVTELAKLKGPSTPTATDSANL